MIPRFARPLGKDPPKALGRPRGRFTQHRRLDKLRAMLEHHPKGMTLYELAEAVGVTPRSMRRYLKEVSQELELQPVPTRAGGALRWRVKSGDLPRKIELRRTQAYAILAARRLFEPMRGSTLFDEIEMATERLLALAQRPGRGPNAGLADARLEQRFLYLPVAPKDYSTKTEELDDLFQAVADLRPLKCRYRSGSRGDDAAKPRPPKKPSSSILTPWCSTRTPSTAWVCTPARARFERFSWIACATPSRVRSSASSSPRFQGR